MFLLGRFARAIGCHLKVGTHELSDGSRVVLESGEGGVHRLDEGLEGREIAVVGLVALDVAPEMLNRVVVW